ncbi:MAG: RNA polymerase sigma factor [Alphaproteobacteria bacterium]|jgi:RNA polymerase sigma-70 factor (ECF subfamily)
MPLDRRQLVQEFAARLYGYAMSLCADPTLAEDLSQEAVTRSIAAETAPADSPAFRAWLFRILRNAWIDHMRREGRLVTLDSDDMTDCIDNHRTDGPEIFDDSMINALTVRFALGRLLPAQREIIGLVDIAGFSYSESADVLEIPVGTVMSRLSRARKELAKTIVDTNIVPMPLKAARQS